MNRRNFIIGGGIVGISSLTGCTGTERDPEPSSDTEQNPETNPEEELEEDFTTEEESEAAENTVNYDHLYGITGFTWPPDIEGNHSRRYEWTAAGYEWWYETQIPMSLSEYYSNRFSRSGEFEIYVTDAFGKSYIKGLADEFERMADDNGLSEVEIFNLAINFVQQMRYTKDDVTSSFDQYSYYPVENLIREGGDCEDSALLLSAILTQMGYGCVLLYLPDTNPAHMAMGVKGSSSIPGTYYNYNGNRYYYIEGTADYAVGEFPDSIDGNTTAEIIPVNPPYPTVVYGYATGIQDGSVTVQAEIRNKGNGTAQNVEFIAGFEDENERAHSEDSSTITVLSGGQTANETLYLEPPDDKKLRLITGVTSDGVLHDKKKSGWQYPVS